MLHEVFDPLNASMANLAGALVFDLAAVAAWQGGAYARTRRLYVAELRDRAERARRTPLSVLFEEHRRKPGVGASNYRSREGRQQGGSSTE